MRRLMINRFNESMDFFVFSIVLKLIRPMVCEKGQRFTIRDSFKTIATGVVANTLPSLSETERLELIEGKKKLKKRLAQA